MATKSKRSFDAANRARKAKNPPLPVATEVTDSQVRLITKAEVIERTSLTFVSIWRQMVAGTFPPARKVGGKSLWIEAEIGSKRCLSANTKQPRQRNLMNDNPAVVGGAGSDQQPIENADLSSSSPLNSKAWRNTLPVHPAADLFPLISKDELRELAADIDKHGLREKIAVSFGDGHKCFLLDGRNRLDGLALLGRRLFDDKGELLEDLRTVPDGVISDADCVAYIISKNIHRRHLTPSQKRDLFAKLLKAKPETSNRQIAKQVGRDDKTVAKVRAELESTSEIPRLTKTVGKDGKSRPARVSAVKSAMNRIIAASNPTPKTDHLKALVDSWREVQAHIDSGNRPRLKAALAIHLRNLKQACAQEGVAP